MNTKLFYVTTANRQGKHTTSRVVGFVSTFGWESAETKAKRKYPNLDQFSLHERPRRFTRK